MASSKKGTGGHTEFVPLIGALERTEAEVGEVEARIVRVDAEVLHDRLAHGLIPHAVGEGRTLFPVLRRVTGSDVATLAMTGDHKQMAHLTDELDRVGREIAKAGLNTERERALRRLLHELRSVVDEHFQAEQESCYQVLDAELGPDEAREMYQAMERATAELRELYE